jgi:hypothetical protein
MNAKTLEILNIHDDMGTAHDFKMFKESAAEVLPEDIIVLGDSGYQGMAECLANAIIPYKASKNHQLTDEEKLYNRMVSGQRIAIEHINREIKIFRICKEVYRGKGKRGLLRVRLIASLYNHRIAL